MEGIDCHTVIDYAAGFIIRSCVYSLHNFSCLVASDTVMNKHFLPRKISIASDFCYTVACDEIHVNNFIASIVRMIVKDFLSEDQNARYITRRVKCSFYFGTFIEWEID